MEVPKLGTEARYLHMAPDGSHIEGRGIVWAALIADDGRVQIRIHDGEKKLNVDLSAINTTKSQSKAYFAGVERIRKHADEVNAKAKALVEKGNDDIEAIRISFMTAPVVKL